MSKQYNKAEKRKRRAAYLKRKKARAKGKTGGKERKAATPAPPAEPVLATAPEVAKAEAAV
jgi:hypothetical protein